MQDTCPVPKRMQISKYVQTFYIQSQVSRIYIISNHPSSSRYEVLLIWLGRSIHAYYLKQNIVCLNVYTDPATHAHCVQS